MRDAFTQQAVCNRITSLCGDVTLDALETRYSDEDLALGSSRVNYRLNHKDGHLQSDAIDTFLRTITDDNFTSYDTSIICAMTGMGRQTETSRLLQATFVRWSLENRSFYTSE